MNTPNAFGNREISFGDEVRIYSTELTERLGFAGLTGIVFGQTVPSTSGVEGIIGLSVEDYAVNVYFEDRDEGFWFREDLLELLDHNAGTQITFDGVDKVWTRTESGQWKEEGHATAKRHTWWQLLKSLFKSG